MSTPAEAIKAVAEQVQAIRDRPDLGGVEPDWSCGNSAASCLDSVLGYLNVARALAASYPVDRINTTGKDHGKAIE